MTLQGFRFPGGSRFSRVATTATIEVLIPRWNCTPEEPTNETYDSWFPIFRTHAQDTKEEFVVVLCADDIVLNFPTSRQALGEDMLDVPLLIKVYAEREGDERPVGSLVETKVRLKDINGAVTGGGKFTSTLETRRMPGSSPSANGKLVVLESTTKYLLPGVLDSFYNEKDASTDLRRRNSVMPAES
jgi:hypothetical protein